MSQGIRLPCKVNICSELLNTVLVAIKRSLRPSNEQSNNLQFTKKISMFQRVTCQIKAVVLTALNSGLHYW